MYKHSYLYTCAHTHAPTNLILHIYVFTTTGKKICATCSCPVLMCSRCCEKKIDKSTDITDKLKVRCPLCVKQDCTVLASEVSLKDNGKRVKLDVEGDVGGEEGDGGGANSRVAKTVLKWGGGHSVEKQNKKKRKEEDRRKNYKSIECRFGVECNRKDCWFKHSG